jgi:hypothetical protein
MNGLRKTSVLTALILGLVFSVLALANCGGGEDNPVDPGKKPPAGPDTIAPAEVADLRLRAPTQTTLALVWTAPGDDGTVGTATNYDIRMSKALITEGNWDQASPLGPGVVPRPKPGGQIETTVISYLVAGETYYFALTTSDEVSNRSGLSNCCFETTLNETTPPEDIKDLKATAIDALSFALTWTAPGDDYDTGTATRYDIRYSVRPITNDEEWDRALVATNPPDPKPAGESESFVISELAAVSHFFAIKTVDELDNWSRRSNQAIGLEFGEVLWAFPTWIEPGDRIYIAFRASGSGITEVSINTGSYSWEERACGLKRIVDVVNGPLAEGVYTMTFDFIDPRTGEYIPAGYYELFLCYGTDLQEFMNVYFN